MGLKSKVTRKIHFAVTLVTRMSLTLTRFASCWRLHWNKFLGCSSTQHEQRSRGFSETHKSNKRWRGSSAKRSLCWKRLTSCVGRRGHSSQLFTLQRSVFWPCKINYSLMGGSVDGGHRAIKYSRLVRGTNTAGRCWLFVDYMESRMRFIPKELTSWCDCYMF